VCRRVVVGQRSGVRGQRSEVRVDNIWLMLVKDGGFISMLIKTSGLKVPEDMKTLRPEDQKT